MHHIKRISQSVFERLLPLVNRKFTLCVFLLTAITTVYAAWIRGPTPIVDSLSDAGGGKITVEWSLSKPSEGQEYGKEHPDEVCAAWTELVNGERGETSDECITTGISTQDNITIDTGIGGETQPSEFSVILVGYYDGARMWKPDWTDVTLNAAN